MNVNCPVCETEGAGESACPVCGWFFSRLNNFSYEADLAEAKKQWRLRADSGDGVEIQEEKTELEDSESLPEEDAIVVNDKTDHMKELVNAGVEKVILTFEQRLMYDKVKEQQINRLHAELQEYKHDLLAKTNRPLINGLIFMYDDMDKLVKKFEDSKEKLSTEQCIKILKEVGEDIEILLETNGTVTFVEDIDKFNPERQQVVKKVPASDREKVGRISEHIRPGFEYGNDLIRKERVAVYVYKENTIKDDKHTERNVEEDERIANIKVNN